MNRDLYGREFLDWEGLWESGDKNIIFLVYKLGLKVLFWEELGRRLVFGDLERRFKLLDVYFDLGNYWGSCYTMFL